jgi:protein-tyrosine-phosphatase
MKRILLVCTGNICRSPMAEGFLKAALSEKGIRGVEVASAGTYALVGNPAELQALEVMRPFGVDLSEHRARPLSMELIRWADAILVMSPQHWAFVEEMESGAADKVRLLGAYAPRGEPDEAIDDPYGGSTHLYRSCAVEINEAVNGFLAQEADNLGI